MCVWFNLVATFKLGADVLLVFMVAHRTWVDVKAIAMAQFVPTFMANRDT